MKVKVRIKNKKNRTTHCLLLIERMIIYKKVDLSLVNQNIRINNRSLYVTALRLAREENSVKNYIEYLTILRTDILSCKNKEQKEYLNKTLETYTKLNPFQGEKEFENYKKTLLQAM